MKKGKEKKLVSYTFDGKRLTAEYLVDGSNRERVNIPLNRINKFCLDNGFRIFNAQSRTFYGARQ